MDFSITDVGEGWHCSLDLDTFSAFATFVPKHLADNEKMAKAIAENRFKNVITQHSDNTWEVVPSNEIEVW